MDKLCNILYVSCLCSASKMRKLFDTAKDKPQPAVQKFHSLVVKGLVTNCLNVTCLTALPVTLNSHPNKKWWKREEEVVEGVRYVYMPFYNSPYFKLMGFKVYAFFFTLIWGVRTQGGKAMICDVLNAPASGSRKACKLVRMPSVGIVTDIPGLMVGQKTDSLIRRFFIKKSIHNIRRMKYLVPLTEAMCDIINPKYNTPYVVVEGVVDSAMESQDPTPFLDGKRHVTYTGTIDARYGVKTMIEAFMLLRQNDVVLDVYGKGPMEDEMQNYSAQDSRIRYHGVVTIEEAVAAQRASFFLINPRPTKEEFTKYSFPSKNMEYMATGVPLLTAALPGMPKEYHPFVFLFEDETAEGICRRMNDILSLPEAEVRERGRLAKQFVMENKNDVQQAKRIIELIEGDVRRDSSNGLVD